MAAKPATGEIVDPNTMFQLRVEDETADDLSDVLAELGGIDDAKINIYRAGGAKGMRGGEFVDSIHPIEFSLQWLRDNYGGGEYRVHVRGNGRIITNRMVKIADPIRRSETAPNSGVNNMSFGGLEKLVETMQAGFMQLGQLIVKSAEVSRPAQVDPMAMQQQTMQMLLTMKQFVEPSQPQGNSSDAMSMFLKGLEVAKELKGDFSDREPGSSDILLKAVEAFAPAIASMAATPKPQQIQPQMMPALPLPEQFAQPAQNFSTGDVMTQQLKQYSAMLVMLARDNKDPYAYASLICDSTEPSEILAVVNRPDVYTYLASINPDLGDPSIRPWLDEFISEIKNILTPPQDLSSVGLTSISQGSENAFVSTSLGTYSSENADNSHT